MLPQTHIILGIIFATIVFLLFPSVGILGAGIIFFSSVLIDMDHYIYFIHKTKKLNPVKAYHWYKGHKEKCRKVPKEKKKGIHFGTYFLHGIEILIILFLLGNFISPIFYFILIGFTFHLLSDLTLEITLFNEYNKISVIYTFLKSRGMTFIDDLEI